MKNLKGLATLGVCIGMLLCPLGGCAPRGGGLSAASGSRSEPEQPPLSSSSQQEALKEKIPPKILMTGGSALDQRQPVSGDAKRGHPGIL